MLSVIGTLQQIILQIAAPVIIYDAAFFSSLPARPTALDITRTREALSAVHCTLVTILCLSCLYYHDTFTILSPSNAGSLISPVPNESLLIITLKSSFANAITAYELGYLAADTEIIVYAHRQAQSAASKASTSLRTSGSKLTRTPASHIRSLNIRHLLTHHVIFITAFMLLQLYIYFGRERGVLVIMLLMLQNASSPLGVLKWHLRGAEKTGIIMITSDIAYITAFAVCRVYLPYWIVARFAAVQHRGFWEQLWSLKWHCQVGTMGMMGVNMWWTLSTIKNTMKRYNVSRSTTRSKNRREQFIAK